MERVSDDGNKSFRTTGKTFHCLNLGSYNYLGFADDWMSTCSKSVFGALENHPVSYVSSSSDYGVTTIHKKLEETIAEFLGVESAVAFNMGFGTNSNVIPCLVGKGCLVISDELNHTSIVSGCRISGAHIRVFKHCDLQQLESILIEAIRLGMPRTYLPWKKIVVLVEGVYSMEGGTPNLPEVVKLCKKYKCYLYVDEAHSIGALGSTGRGVCEHYGVNTKDIDILMGTFTKSFGGMGGYVAGSTALINHIKSSCPAIVYHNSMSPIVCQQVLTAFEVYFFIFFIIYNKIKIIMGKDGTDIGKKKIQKLRENANYFRDGLVKIGVHLYGEHDCPIIPMLIYHPGKIAAFSRELLKRGVGVNFIN